MADVLFVLKTFLATFILLVLMQIQIGNDTIEYHVEDWVHTSSAVHGLNNVAHGAIKMASRSYQTAASYVDSKIDTSGARAHMIGARELQASAEEKAEEFKQQAIDKARAAEELFEETELSSSVEEGQSSNVTEAY